MKFFGFKTAKNEKPLFQLMRMAFPKGFDFDKYKIYHIKSFENTEYNLDLFEANLNNERLPSMLNRLYYNSQGDNVGVYFLLTKTIGCII